MKIQNIQTKQVLGSLMIYTTIRAFSYFFSPSTPLYNANPVNWIISAGILSVVIYFLLKKNIGGWIIITAELILGGAGSFLEIGGIALRTISRIKPVAHHTKRYCRFGGDTSLADDIDDGRAFVE